MERTLARTIIGWLLVIWQLLIAIVAVLLAPLVCLIMLLFFLIRKITGNERP
jgi:hypothetical protein